MLNPGGGWGGVEVLGVKMLRTAEKIDNFFNPPVGGARAKLGNQLVYYIKLQFSLSGCLSVPPLFFRHDRRTATKFGTHIRVDTGLILSLKIFYPPQRGPMGVLGGF